MAELIPTIQEAPADLVVPTVGRGILGALVITINPPAEVVVLIFESVMDMNNVAFPPEINPTAVAFNLPSVDAHDSVPLDSAEHIVLESLDDESAVAQSGVALVKSQE